MKNQAKPSKSSKSGPHRCWQNTMGPTGITTWEDKQLIMFWLYSQNITAEYWNSDAAQYNSRLSALPCQADSSSTINQVECYWRASAAKRWNPQPQDDISRVSCKAADSTLQKHFWTVKTSAQSWNPVAQENLKTLIALITTDYH